MGIYQVEYCLGGNYIRRNFLDWNNLGGNFPGGNYPGRELSGWELYSVGIFLGGNFPSENCPVRIIWVGIFWVGVFLVSFWIDVFSSMSTTAWMITLAKEINVTTFIHCIVTRKSHFLWKVTLKNIKNSPRGYFPRDTFYYIWWNAIIPWTLISFQ